MAVALTGNNPGGINDGAWAASQPGYTGANGRYASFATMADGLNAQQALLDNYVAQGVNTPAEIAAKYAPASDGNNQTAYAQNLANSLGIDVNTPITAAQVPTMMQWQDALENGASKTNTDIQNWFANAGVNGTAATSSAASGGTSTASGGVMSTIANALGIAQVEETITNLFVRGGVFVLGFLLIAFGLYYLADNASDGAISDGVKTAAKSAAAA